MEWMARENLAIVHLVYQRKVENINSFLTIPIEIREEWVDYRLVTGMANVARDFRNLKGWEFVCYYYNQIEE